MLTPRQKRFAAEYLVDLDGAKAVVRAGYSPRSAKVTACRLLKRAQIRAAVDAGMAKAAERVGVRQDTVLRELLAIARVDPAEVFDEKGQLRPLKDIPEDVRRAISGLDVESSTDQRGVLKKVRFWDKPRALELLGKHLGMFTERVKIEGPTLEQLVQASLDDEAKVIDVTPSPAKALTSGT